MQTLHTISELRTRIASWRNAGEYIALVPTMGNLHAGHLALVEYASRIADRVVVSIFVNPLQFGEGEDFDAYPRTLEADSRQLISYDVSAIFAPSEREMYPRGRGGVTRVLVPGITDILCGAARPGHFDGVATVVTKLFNITQPNVAVFGEKDYQQLLVIRRLSADLNLPVEVRAVPTVREADGLAMSSRNAYLSTEERARAPGLHQTLAGVRDAVRAGRRDFSALQAEAMQRLEREGFSPEYVSVRRAADLGEPAGLDEALVVLGAARLGKARLIDNLLINKG